MGLDVGYLYLGDFNEELKAMNMFLSYAAFQGTPTQIHTRRFDPFFKPSQPAHAASMVRYRGIANDTFKIGHVSSVHYTWNHKALLPSLVSDTIPSSVQ
jgi:hypothetical protein